MLIGLREAHVPARAAVPRVRPHDARRAVRTRRACSSRASRFVVDPVEEFQLDQNRVKTKSGKTFDYDILAIATGSRPVPELIPGLAENSETFYTEETAVKMFRTAAGVPGRARRDRDGRAAQVPDGAAGDHVHAARLLQGSGHPRQGSAALHLSRSGASTRWRTSPSGRRPSSSASASPTRRCSTSRRSTARRRW